MSIFSRNQLAFSRVSLVLEIVGIQAGMKLAVSACQNQRVVFLENDVVLQE